MVALKGRRFESVDSKAEFSSYRMKMTSNRSETAAHGEIRYGLRPSLLSPCRVCRQKPEPRKEVKDRALSTLIHSCRLRRQLPALGHYWIGRWVKFQSAPTCNPLSSHFIGQSSDRCHFLHLFKRQHARMSSGDQRTRIQCFLPHAWSKRIVKLSCFQRKNVIM
jgi:hypothetical protein